MIFPLRTRIAGEQGRSRGAGSAVGPVRQRRLGRRIRRKAARPSQRRHPLVDACDCWATKSAFRRRLPGAWRSWRPAIPAWRFAVNWPARPSGCRPARRCRSSAACRARARTASDPYLPLLLWWAVERHSIAAREDVLAMFSEPAVWQLPLVRETILPRLMRRYAAEAHRAGLSGLREIAGRHARRGPRQDVGGARPGTERSFDRSRRQRRRLVRQAGGCRQPMRSSQKTQLQNENSAGSLGGKSTPPGRTAPAT